MLCHALNFGGDQLTFCCETVSNPELIQFVSFSTSKNRFIPTISVSSQRHADLDGPRPSILLVCDALLNLVTQCHGRGSAYVRVGVSSSHDVTEVLVTGRRGLRRSYISRPSLGPRAVNKSQILGEVPSE